VKKAMRVIDHSADFNSAFLSSREGRQASSVCFFLKKCRNGILKVLDKGLGNI
jgi:hypothetical protein